MKKIIIAVDETTSSRAVLFTFHNIVSRPEEIILLHVERLEGRSMMIDMLSDSEISTLKEMVNQTEYKSALDEKAGEILSFYKKEFENAAERVKTFVRTGRPAEEILKLAEEEGADLILLGFSKEKGINRFISGSVVKDVKKGANIPVLTAKKPATCEEPYSWRDAYTAITVTTAIVIGMFLLGIILQKGPLH